MTMHRTDQFAEYLANGMTVRQISERMGMSIGTAEGILRRIRAGLGPQAI